MTSLRTSRRLAIAASTMLAVASGTALMTAPSAAAAGECARYAAPTGSDTSAGTSSAPYRTSQKLVASLAAGQVGCLATGTYTGNIAISTDGITLRSVPGQRATLSLGTLEIRDGAEDVTISDLRIVGGGGALTMRPIGDRFTITRNEITNNNAGMSCILVGAQAATTTGGVVSGNRIHHCGKLGINLDHGIYAQNFAPGTTGPGLLVEDNVFHNLGAYSVQLYPNGTGAVVRHNVIDGAGGSIRGGIVIDGAVARNHRVEQNVISYTQTGGIVQRTGSGHASVNNCYYANSGGDVSGSGITRSGDINANPLFVNRSAGDYRMSSGSACLSKVGYDIAAKVASLLSGSTATTATTSPSPTSSPAPASSPSPSSSPAPVSSPSPTVATTTNTAPRVSITSPTAGAVVSRDLRLTAVASDDKGVTKVEFRIDGVLKAVETSAPYDQWTSVATLTGGTHVLQARAYDASGLTSNASVTFSKS